MSIASKITSKTQDKYQKFLDVSAEELWAKVSKNAQKNSNLEQTQDAINIINEELHINMNKNEAQSVSLLIQGLMDIERFRFGGKIDIHHPLDFHNSTGQHTLSVCVNEILPIFQNVSAQYKDNKTHMRNVAEHFRGAILSTLMHDLGEMIMEFSSFAEESSENAEEKQADKDDQIILEADIARFYLTLSQCAALSGDNEAFFKSISDMRAQIVDNEHQRSKHSYKKTAKILRDYFESYDFNGVHPSYEEDKKRIEKTVNNFMRYYKQAENYENTTGIAVKVAEIIDGNVTFQDSAATFDDHISNKGAAYILANNNRTMGVHRRNEASLHQLFQAAANETHIEHEIANAVAKRSYEVLLWNVLIGPPSLHRPKSGELKSNYNHTLPMRDNVSLDDSRLEELTLLFGKEAALSLQDDFTNAADKVFQRDTISARSLLLLYSAAYCVENHLEHLDTYNTPLIYQRDIHDDLLAHIQILDYMEKEGLWANDRFHLDFASVHFAALTYDDKPDSQDLLYKLKQHRNNAESTLIQNADKLKKFYKWYEDWQKDSFPKLLQHIHNVEPNLH